jgi:hypothetical protein
MWFSTPGTPGAADVAHSASSRSIRDVTFARSVILPLAAPASVQAC